MKRATILAACLLIGGCSAVPDAITPTMPVTSTPAAVATSNWVGLAAQADPTCTEFSAAPRDEQEHLALMIYLDLWQHAGGTTVPSIDLVTDWTTTLISTCEGSGETVGFVTGAVMWTGYRGKYQPRQ